MTGDYEKGGNMDKDLQSLIDNAVNKEKELAQQADELALQDKKFAEYLAAKKHQDEEIEVLWQMVKEYMIDNDYSEYENDYIKLNLSSSGKYRATIDMDDIDDTLCDFKKVLNNKKVKSYVELNGTLPQGIESTGYILRKTIK